MPKRGQVYVRVLLRARITLKLCTHGETWYNSTKSREQSISIKKLDAILENSKRINSEADRKNRHIVDGYTYFTGNININAIVPSRIPDHL